MVVKYTEEMWQQLNEYGKKLPPFSEEYERQITRKLMKMPAEIPWLFEGYRFDLRKKMKSIKEMQETLPRVAVSKETRVVLELVFQIALRENEVKIDLWDHLEALALNQIEFRKDLGKVIKALEKTDKNKKSVVELQKKMRDTENDLQEFRKTKPYIKFAKRYFDERKGHTEDD